ARIQTLGVVQDRLHSSREPGQVDIRQVLLGICDELLELHGVGDRVRCEVEVPGFAIAMERAVPLALLAAEAVMNALQHAFPGGRVGTVWIRFSETPDEVRIAIE